MPELISMLMLAFAFLLAVLVPLCISYFGWRSYFDPVMGVKLALWLFLVDTFLPLPALPVGVTIFAPDLLYLILMMIGVFRLFLIRDFRASHGLWLILGVVLSSLFVAGSFKFRTAAGVEFRQFFAFWAGALYLMTFQLERKQVDDIFRAWILVATVMVPLVCFRWLAMGLGLSVVQQWNEGGESLRVVAASQTLFLAQAFIVVHYLRQREIGPQWWGWMQPIFFGCVLVLQHRSVWVVMLTSLGVIYIIMRGKRHLMVKQFVVAAIVGIVLLGPLAAMGKLDVIFNALEHSVEETGTEKSTLMWRMQSSDELLKNWINDGPVVWLVGKPFGSGFERYVKAQDNIKVNLNPHNFYVMTILRGGAIGLLAMVLVYLIAIRKFMAAGLPAGEMVDTRLLGILLIGQMLFYITYQAPEIQFIPVGLALALGASMFNRDSQEASYSLEKTEGAI